MAVQRGTSGRSARAAPLARGRSLRIAALYEEGTANSHYRVVLPLRELARRGHRVLWPAERPPATLLSGTPDFDVFLLHHFYSEDVIALVERLGREGVAVVWDKDDDMAATPRSAAAYKGYGGRRGIRRGAKRSVALARAASLMTTPSAHLAARFREQGVEHVEVIENYVAAEEIGGRRPRVPGVVIGITAAQEHGTDLKRLRVDRMLTRVLEAHDGVRVVSIGWDHDLPAGRHRNLRHVPIKDLIAAERQFDIGIAPLADSPFNRARSNVKLKEYAAAGAMWLASPVGPYRELGEQQGGLLVADDDWCDVLGQLVVDFRRRAELMERARAWVRLQTMDRGVQQWESALQRAVERVRAANPY